MCAWDGSLPWHAQHSPQTEEPQPGPLQQAFHNTRTLTEADCGVINQAFSQHGIKALERSTFTHPQYAQNVIYSNDKRAAWIMNKWGSMTPTRVEMVVSAPLSSPGMPAMLQPPDDTLPNNPDIT